MMTEKEVAVLVDILRKERQESNLFCPSTFKIFQKQYKHIIVCFQLIRPTLLSRHKFIPPKMCELSRFRHKTKLFQLNSGQKLRQSSWVKKKVPIDRTFINKRKFCLGAAGGILIFNYSNNMNIDWDEELAEYFHLKYMKAHKKLSSNSYQITTLEGSDVEFECSIEGYTCRCHDKKYELPMGLLKEHSKEYVKAFNHELNVRLQALADLENSEDTDK